MLTKREVQDLWIEALSSGKYIQGKGVLGNHHNGFCCLGVLCQLAVDHGVIEYFGPMKHHPPKEVMDWAGLKTNSGDYIECNLIDDNDSKQLSFRQIADVIETKRDVLFHG